MPVPTEGFFRTVCAVAVGEAMARREDDRTIGEVYRHLVDMDQRTEKKLDRIEEQVRLTNGRTTRLEERVELLRSQHPITPSSLPVVTPEGESLSIKVSPKMWAAIVSGGAVLWVAAQWAADWLKKLGN